MNARDAWIAMLGHLEVELGRPTFSTWLGRAELLGVEDDRFVVTVPNIIVQGWIERHLHGAMTNVLQRIYQKPCEIQLVAWQPVEDDDALASTFSQGVNRGETLHPDYTFDQYQVGEANRFAVVLAQAVCESELGRYSPVLFHGPMGVGKTHLLQAMAHRLLARGHTVIYTTAEGFTNEMVAAIRGDNAASFRDKFRNADVVLIDDLQFIEGKESTQHELIAIWDALRNRQRTIVFAANQLPNDMHRVIRDAKSRFQAGPIANIDPPDVGLRRAVLQHKAAQRALSLPNDICDMLTERIEGNVRDLESIVHQLHTFTHLMKQPLAEAVTQVLRANGQAAKAPSARTTNLDSVLKAVMAYYGVSNADLLSRRRTKALTLARQVAMYLAREDTSATLPQIGAVLGGRNHTTVLHGCAKIAESMPELANDLAVIRQGYQGQASSAGIKVSQRPEPVMA
jgi:chromosomal replication initiator protein